MSNNELYHHGILGMKWGIRRYQNKDGTLTNAGKKRQASRDAEIKNEEEHLNYAKKESKRAKELLKNNKERQRLVDKTNKIYADDEEWQVTDEQYSKILKESIQDNEEAIKNATNNIKLLKNTPINKLTPSERETRNLNIGGAIGGITGAFIGLRIHRGRQYAYGKKTTLLTALKVAGLSTIGMMIGSGAGMLKAGKTNYKKGYKSSNGANHRGTSPDDGGYVYDNKKY